MLYPEPRCGRPYLNATALEINAQAENMGIEPYIRKLDAGIGNMEKAVIEGIGHCVPEKLQSRSRIYQKLELGAEFPVRHILPVGIGYSHAKK